MGPLARGPEKLSRDNSFCIVEREHYQGGLIATELLRPPPSVSFTLAGKPGNARKAEK